MIKNKLKNEINQLSMDDLHLLNIFVVNCIRDACVHINRKHAWSMRVGDTVSFTGKRHNTLTGKVIKMNPTRAKVSVTILTNQGFEMKRRDQIWNVPYTFLTVVK